MLSCALSPACRILGLKMRKFISCKSVFLAALILSVATALVSCSAKDEALQKKRRAAETAAKAVKPPEPKKPEPPPKAQKMVMIVVDALRADRLGCYGFKEPTSPTIDALAREGVLFEKAHAASPWTAPSFGTLFTGVSPTVHGAGSMLAKGSDKGTSLMGVTIEGLRKDLPALFELLPDEVQTAAILTNAFLSEELGFKKGFDSFDQRNAAIRRYRTADETTQKAVEWLKEHSKKPFFLLVHYFDPHMQYGPPEKYVEMFAPNKPKRISAPFADHDAARDGSLDPNEDEKRFIRGLYNGEVRFVDDQLAVLMETMKRLELMDDTWIVLTSDHGEEHFEHGSFEHGHAYEEEVTRVPLILRPPKGKWRAGARIDLSVRHIDIPPTILALFGEPAPRHFEGRSLAPMITGEDSLDRAAYMEFNLFHGQQCSLFDGRYKIVWDTRRKGGFYYDLKEDPSEMNRLDEQQPKYDELFERLQKKRDELKKAARNKVDNTVTFSKEAEKALKSLGYIE
jgi:arylsulfatase A-like enzyme